MWLALWVDLLGSSWDLLGLESVSGDWSELFVPLEGSFLEFNHPVGFPDLSFLRVVFWSASPPRESVAFFEFVLGGSQTQVFLVLYPVSATFDELINSSVVSSES